MSASTSSVCTASRRSSELRYASSASASPGAWSGRKEINSARAQHDGPSPRRERQLEAAIGTHCPRVKSESVDHDSERAFIGHAAPDLLLWHGLATLDVWSERSVKHEQRPDRQLVQRDEAEEERVQRIFGSRGLDLKEPDAGEDRSRRSREGETGDGDRRQSTRRARPMVLGNSEARPRARGRMACAHLASMPSL